MVKTQGPGVKRNNLQCPTCRSSGIDSGTEVSYTRTSTDHTRITRQRRCLTNPEHLFHTDERLRAMSMERLWVRRTGSQRLSPFSLARLARELQRDTLGILGADDGVLRLPTCDVDFGYPQGLTIHQELGCEWGDDDSGGDNYCCGILYEDGESTCMSCGEPL